MMKKFMKSILTLGITAGLMNREAFTEKIAGFIEQYQDDPEKAEKWAEMLVKYLEEMRNDLRSQQNITAAVSSSGIPEKDDIAALTKAIEALTKELKKSKEH